MKLSILVTEMLCSIYTKLTKVTSNVVHWSTTLSLACLCLQRLFMLIKEDLCRIFPVMISLRGLLYEYGTALCILSFTACLLKPQGILNSQGRFAFVSKSIHLVLTGFSLTWISKMTLSKYCFMNINSRKKLSEKHSLT